MGILLYYWIGNRIKIFERATHVGPTKGEQLAKLANQMIVAITIGNVAKAFLMCEKGGANIAKVK
jgi:3-hydroxyisobutyrate dehydrogenase-like beta-hydroxyacid dehydrogenase